MSVISEVHQNILVKLHQLKQAAVAELKHLESAVERTLHLNGHIAELDTEIVGVAERIKATGAHTLGWADVSTIPEAAKVALAANAPPPEPAQVQDVQKLAEAAPTPAAK